MKSELDLDSRCLCPDGSCIGVLDEQGRCGECGQHFGSDVKALPALEAAPGKDDAWDEDRELCPDGSCLGVLGSDGHCKECGRARV